VPRSTNETDENSLPDPELNPLLNPLLAAHMGRWAEVYFTNPPEKRGQAVAELLRELENISPPEPGPVQVTQAVSGQKTEKKETADSDVATVEHSLTCGACAYSNAAGQRFCGMCGAALRVSPESHVTHVAEAMPVAGTGWSEPEPSLGGNPVEYAVDRASNFTTEDGRRAILDQTWPIPQENLPSFAVEAEPVPYRYRLYIGVVLAILLVVLGYMAWRGTQVFSGAPTPQAAPAKASTPLPTEPAASTPASPTKSDLPERNPTASTAQGQNQPDASSQKEQAADKQPAPQIVPVAASSSPAAVEPSGAEDLATAEKYLNGNAGLARDSKEAAQWLWKAVGKQNLAATLALSDLYLRGDGVPKNCDQARLLLDAAARKGAAAAAERLRNLQAFGCE
jgi:cell division septation protein DedD